MTISEAIDELLGNYWKCIAGEEDVCIRHNEAIELAIKALEFMQQHVDDGR